MAKTDSDSTLKAITTVCVVTTLIVEPFAVVALWRWFVMPIGAPALTWASAFGMNLIANVWLQYWPGDMTDRERAVSACFSLIKVLIALALGWLAMKLAA